MVATLTSFPAATIPPSVISGRGALLQFSVDTVLQMIRGGEIQEDARTELLNGFIVHVDRSEAGGAPATHSPGHSAAVRRLTALVSIINTAERQVQIQLPIICGHAQMPEPDFAVIRGSNDKFTDKLPDATVTCCVIEVADSSLERDRYEKGPIYAAAAIAQYIILNLRNRTAEVYANPDPAAGTYAAPQIFPAESSFDLRVGVDETITIAVASLLP